LRRTLSAVRQRCRVPLTARRVLLDPLGPHGDRRYQHAVYDLDTDTAVSPPVTTARADAVLLLDGVFLLRPELIDLWEAAGLRGRSGDEGRCSR